MAIFFNKSWPYGYESSFNNVPGVFQKVRSGLSHTVALSSGKLFVTGLARSGRLGLPDSAVPPSQDLEYYTISGFTCFLPNETFIDIRCGGETTFALSANGVWFACGSNTWSELGFASAKYPWPLSVRNFEQLPQGFNKWDQLEVGLYHGVALSGKTIFTCGLNNEGQTGHPQSSNTTDGFNRTSAWAPIPGTWEKLAEITPGSRHTMALSANNKWFGCGHNFYGELGLNATTGSVFGMYPIPGEWTRMICTRWATFALSTNGQWFAAGINDYGQLGLGDLQRRLAFTPLTGNWKDIVCGGVHTFAQSANGVWFGTGSNYQGQLGISTVPVPSELWTISSFRVVFNGANFIDKIVTGGTGTSFTLIREDNYQPPLSGSIITFRGQDIVSFSGINIRLI